MPVAGANVFILETLDGVLTDSSGRFSIVLGAPLPVTLIVKRLGFEQVSRAITATDTAALAIVLSRAATALAPITVQAGAYTASDERGATLTSLEVVTTPGTSADVNRAIQLLPGVQPIDDGTALFVRGGDFTETKVFFNEAPLLNPAQLISPSGTFVGTVDPFQLDGIFFSSGGFGARYGNALSGVVGLKTRGEALRSTATVGAGLAAYSGDLAWRVTNKLTLRAAGNRLDLDPFFKVNSNPRAFSPAPHGRDVSLSSTLTYRPTGELKAYVIDQTNLVGVPVDEPAFSGTFNSDVRSRLSVLTWRDVVGSVAPLISIAESRLDRREDFGAFRLHSRQRLQQGFGQLSWESGSGTVIRAGGEFERIVSDMTGSLPSTEDRRPEARSRLFSFDEPGRRVGAFVETDLRIGSTLRLIPGVRADRSSLTERTTFDPRVNASWRPVELFTFTAAWGLYHQVPDPLFFDDSTGHPGLAPMRAEQRVVGVQVGEGVPFLIRLELYDKQYTDLAQQTRDFHVVEGGTGYSRGVDFFVKGGLFWGIETRTTASWLFSRRTEPNTGLQAPAPFDIRRTMSFIAERPFANGLRTGVTWRSASGKPFTPITGGTLEGTTGVYSPQYGTPFSERYPGLGRLDVSVSRFRPLSPSLQSVVYVSLSNLLNRDNVQGWRYSNDYSSRTPVRSIFNRSVYFGATLIWQ
jgi:hypothetical protein